MQKLHLVGFTAGLDGLILSVRKGSSSGGFVVELDDALVQLVGDAERVRTGGMVVQPSKEARSRASRHGSALNPRELQDRLRAGWTVEEVADEAGTDVEWVNRFAAPVKAEQARIVNQARAMTFDKPRLGPSSLPLGPSVRRNLAERGQRSPEDDVDAGWSAFQLDEGLWVVRFAYTSRGRAQEAEWLVDLAEAQLVARDRLASQLGHIGRGRARALAMKQSSPRKRSTKTAKRASVPKKVATKKAGARRRVKSAAPAKKVAPAKKAPAKKAPAKKAPAKKAPAKKAPAKKVAPGPMKSVGQARATRPTVSGSANEAPVPLAAAAIPLQPPASPAPTSPAAGTAEPGPEETSPKETSPEEAGPEEAVVGTQIAGADPPSPEYAPPVGTAADTTFVDEASPTVPVPDDGPVPPPRSARPVSRRSTSGEDRIFRGRRSADASAELPSRPAAVGPLPPPAPIPVPARVREAVSGPIGAADLDPVPIADAEAAPPPNRGSGRRSEPLRAAPVFSPDLIQSAGGRPTNPDAGEGRARNGEGLASPGEESEPDAAASRSQSRGQDVPSAMDTLAALYPPPASSSPAPEKIRRRRLRRS